MILKTYLDRVLRDKAFDFAKDPKYDGCQRGIASVVYKPMIKSWVIVVPNL